MPYRPEDRVTPENEAAIKEQYDAVIRLHHPAPITATTTLPIPSSSLPFFLPILKISDFQLHIHPFAFLFLCIFDLPVWRIINASTATATHGLDSYYTDEQRIQHLLKPRVVRCQPLHQLKSEKSMETNGSAGEYRDVPGDYYIKVPRAHLFPKDKVGTRLQRQLEVDWKLANRKITLISLARLLCFEMHLRDNICMTIRQLVERQVNDELACIQRQRQHQPPALPSDALLSLTQCADLKEHDKQVIDGLHDPERYPAFDVWWEQQQKGNLIKSYDPAMLGLAMHWIDMVNRISLSPELRYVSDVPVNYLWLQIFRTQTFPGGLEACNRAVKEWTKGTVWFRPASETSRAQQQFGASFLRAMYASQVRHWASEVLEWRASGEAKLMQTLYIAPALPADPSSSKEERIDSPPTHVPQQRRKRKDITTEATPSSLSLLPSDHRRSPPPRPSSASSFSSAELLEPFARPASSQSLPCFSSLALVAASAAVQQEEVA